MEDKRESVLLSDKGGSFDAGSKQLFAEGSATFLPSEMAHGSIALDPEHLALLFKVLHGTGVDVDVL